MIGRLAKEKCSHCLRNINTGQLTFECFKCNAIFHSRCFRQSNTEIINQNFYCINCKLSIVKQYNPFQLIINEDSDDDDVDTYLQKMSLVLEQCKSYSTNEFNMSKKKTWPSMGACFL